MASALPWIGWALVLLGLYLLVQRGFRRRFRGGLLTILGGIALWIGLADPGGRQDRRMLILSGAAAAEDGRLENVVALLAKESPSMKISAILMGAESSRPAGWSAADQYRPVVDSGRVKVDKDDWIQPLGNAIRAALLGRERATLLFDLKTFGDQHYGGYRSADGLGQLLKALDAARPEGEQNLRRGRDLDVLVLEGEKEPARPLLIELSRGRISGNRPISENNASVIVRLPILQDEVWRGGEVNATVRVLRAAGDVVEVRSKTLPWDEGDKPWIEPFLIPFTSFTQGPGAADRPVSGFQHLQVVVTTKDGRKFQGSTHVEVARVPLRILGPAQGAGTLADGPWLAENGAGVAPTVRRLLEDYLRDGNRFTSLNRMGLLEQESLVAWPDLDTVLDRWPLEPGVTVLIEPSQDDLAKLAASTRFHRAIRAGEQVVILGFAEALAAASLPSWLPAVPQSIPVAGGAATGTTLLRYSWQPRLDVVLDSSAVLHGAHGEPKPFASQLAFVEELMVKLGLVETGSSGTPTTPEASLTSAAGLLAPEWRRSNPAISPGVASGENLLFYPGATLLNGLAREAARNPGTNGRLWIDQPLAQAKLAVEPSSLHRRSQLLFRPADTFWRPVSVSDRQPRSRVLFLTALVPQAIDEDSAPTVKTPIVTAGLAGNVDLPSGSKIDRLWSLGIGVDVLRVQPPDRGLAGIASRVLGANRDKIARDLGSMVQEIPDSLRIGNANDKADEYFQLLVDFWEKQPTVRILQHGRVFDPRVEQDRRAPLLHLALTAPSGRTATTFKDDTYAAVQFAGEADIPVVVGSPFGEGFVTVLGYSPFAGDMWVPDIGFPGATTKNLFPHRLKVAPNSRRTNAAGTSITARFDGWGLQRLVDPAVLGHGAEPLGDRPRVEDVVWDPHDGRLSVVSFLPRGVAGLESESLPTPILVLPSGEQPMALAAQNLDSRRAVFSVVLPDDSGEKVHLRWGVDGEVTQLVLPAAEARARGALPMLFRRLAQVRGSGSVYSTSSNLLLHRPVGRSYAATPWVLIALALVFSPLAMTWPAVRRWLVRRGQQGREFYQAPREGIATHAEASTNDWGKGRGLARAILQAGVPGGERIFEPGDSLETSRVESLAGIVCPQIPPQHPVVRLRHTAMARRVWVLIEEPARLHSEEPGIHPDRLQFAELLVGVISSLHLPTGSEVVITPARQLADGEDRSWVVRTSACLRAFASFLEAWPIRVALPLNAPDEIQSSEEVYLLGDLRGVDLDELRELLDRVVQAGGEMTFCSLRSPDDWNLTGLVRDGASGQLFDRSELNAGDLKAADQVHEAQVKGVLYSRGAQALELTTTMSPAEVFDELLEARGGSS